MKTYKYFGSLLLAGAILAGCSKATDTLTPQSVQKQEAEKAAGESENTQTPEAANTFTLSVDASMLATKALTDLGQTLGSEWKQGDSVSVYNATTKEAIDGWLYAQADGTSTVFAGTVSGNFNQGDSLRLEFLAPDYTLQDGTLEGLAGQCDYAVAEVEVTEIDPEAMTIATEQANFEKMQAVVKFSLTNRKEPVEAILVNAFRGVVKAFGIQAEVAIVPDAPASEFYVAIPAVSNLEITFEAKGADGYDYRLIVPKEKIEFERGLYYRRELNMKRKALVKAPVAKTGLSYNGGPQALVDSAHVYWMVNNSEVILDNEKDYQNDSCVISYFVKKEVTENTVPDAPTANENGWLTSIPTQTHAGTYYVWTKMTGNYDYEDADVCDQPVKVVIAKGTPAIIAAAASSALTYNGNSRSLLGYSPSIMFGNTNVTNSKDAANTGCTIKYYVTKENLSTAPAATAEGWGSSYAVIHAGDYYVWIMSTGNGDMNPVTAKVTKSVAKATVTVDVSAVSGDLVFNTQQQNLLSAAAKIKIGTKDVTTATDDQSKACVISYYVSSSNSTATGGSWGTSYSAKNPGTWYVWVKVTGNGDINDVAAASKVSKYIDKATPTVTTTPTARTGLVYNGTAQNLANAGSTNGGTLKYSTDNVNWSNNVPTRTNAGSDTVYWKVVGNDYYYDKSGGSFSVTVAKANGWVNLSGYSNTFSLFEIYTLTINSYSGNDWSISGDTGGYMTQREGNTVMIGRFGSVPSVWTYTISTPETTNYKAASATFTCYSN